MLYSILLWVHILCAITALGANLTYFPWLYRVEKNLPSLLFTLRTIKILDDWVANPAYVLAFFTGIGLLQTAEAADGFTYLTPWILTALVLYGLVSVLGLFVYSPLLKQQIKLAETAGSTAADYQRTAIQVKTLGFVLAGMTIVITFLMAVKPQLW